MYITDAGVSHCLHRKIHLCGRNVPFVLCSSDVKAVPTTGTFRPYGLDCSGFVDWVFYNATEGNYIIGHGGGAHAQHTYCSPISWEEAIPGDLVFYPDDTHVGIVGGWDENGELLIIHCSSRHNNVVITTSEGFVSIGRPQYFVE